MNVDGVPVRPSRDPRSRLERLRPRDMEVLRWAWEQYGARADHVAELIGAASVRVAEKAMSRLRDCGHAELRRYLVGELAWMMPTAQGQRACGVTRCRPLTLKAGWLAHLAAVNAVRLHVQRRNLEAVWIPQRQLSMERERRRGHLPAGIAILGERQAAIEAVLAASPPARFRRVLAVLEARYDAVLCFCAPAPLVQLRRLAAAGGHPKLEAHPLPGLGEGEGAGGGEAAAW